MIPGPDGVLRPVVEAGLHGQMINEITLKLDRTTGEVVKDLTTSTNHANTHDVAPDPQVQQIVNYWVDEGVKRYNIPLATQSKDITRARNNLGESSMGNLAADVLYWDARQDGRCWRNTPSRSRRRDVRIGQPVEPRNLRHGDLCIRFDVVA